MGRPLDMMMNTLVLICHIGWVLILWCDSYHEFSSVFVQIVAGE